MYFFGKSAHGGGQKTLKSARGESTHPRDPCLRKRGMGVDERWPSSLLASPSRPCPSHSLSLQDALRRRFGIGMGLGSRRAAQRRARWILERRAREQLDVLLRWGMRHSARRLEPR